MSQSDLKPIDSDYISDSDWGSIEVRYVTYLCTARLATKKSEKIVGHQIYFVWADALATFGLQKYGKQHCR